MNINDIVNDNKIVSDLQSMRKYINNNKEEMRNTFENIYNDIFNLYKNVSKVEIDDIRYDIKVTLETEEEVEMIYEIINHYGNPIKYIIETCGYNNNVLIKLKL